MTMTVAMSLPLVFTSKRYHRTGRWITATSGLVSVAFGLFLVYRIGIVNGLFPRPLTGFQAKHDAII